MAITYIRGQVAKLYATFAQYGVPTDPTNLKITVYFGTTVIIAATNMTQISTGYYYYDFDIPDGADLGVYSALYTGTLAGVTFKQAEEFEIVETLTREGAVTPTGAYCSIQDVKDYLMGIDRTTLTSLDDTYIAWLIDMTTSEINNYCKQDLASETVKITMFGLKTADVLLPFFPVTTVASATMLSGLETAYTFEKIRYTNCTRHGVSLKTASTDISDADLLVDVAAGTLHVPWAIDLITSTYGFRADITHGYTTIPDDLKYVAIRMATSEVLELKGDQLSGGGSSKTVDGYSVDFKGIAFGGHLSRSDAKLKRVLDRYKLLFV